MPTTDHVQDHVDTIAKHEQEFLARRTPAERLGDSVASVIGRLTFAFGHLAVFAAWVLVNTAAPQRLRFDPYPFQFLACLFAWEAILLACFILMRQARLGRRAEERDHLMLQILLLSEKEITVVVRMNQQIAERVGLRDVAHDRQIAQMGEQTSIDEVAQTIQESIPAEG